MNQLTDSTGVETIPGFICLLKKAIYGLKQAGEIWGSVLFHTLVSLEFKVSSFDKRVQFLHIEEKFVILAVVVDDIKFATNSWDLLTYAKQALSLALILSSSESCKSLSDGTSIAPSLEFTLASHVT